MYVVWLMRSEAFIRQCRRPPPFVVIGLGGKVLIFHTHSHLSQAMQCRKAKWLVH